MLGNTLLPDFISIFFVFESAPLAPDNSNRLAVVPT